MIKQMVLEITDLDGKLLETWPGKAPTHFFSGEIMSYETIKNGVVNKYSREGWVGKGINIYIKDMGGNVLYEHTERPK